LFFPSPPPLGILGGKAKTTIRLSCGIWTAYIADGKLGHHFGVLAELARGLDEHKADTVPSFSTTSSIPPLTRKHHLHSRMAFTYFSR